MSSNEEQDDGDVYFDDEDDNREDALNRLLSNGGSANQFNRDQNGEVKEIAQRVQKKRKSNEQRQEQRRKRQIRANVRVYENSIRCYFVRDVLRRVRSVVYLDDDYAKSQVLSRLQLSDMVKLLDMRAKHSPFMTLCRFLLGVLTKYEIRDLNSIDTLFKFGGVQTRRIFLVDLQPFDLKKIELNYFRGRKDQKKKKNPVIALQKASKLNKIEEESDGEELDDPENYMRVRKRNGIGNLASQVSDGENSQMSQNCLDALAKVISQSKILNDSSQVAQQKREALKGEGSKHEWLDIFDWDSKIWRLVDCKGHVVYDQEVLKRELNGVPTVLLYSVRTLDVKPEHDWLFAHRNLRKMEVTDQTNRFCDNTYDITNRRRRIGLRAYLPQFIRALKFRGSDELLTSTQLELRAVDEKLDYELACKYFPRGYKEMRDSQTFIIPSMIDKFFMLKDIARPTQHMFKEEQVFLRKDMMILHSKYAWIDVGRMVKEDEQPTKSTLTRDGKELKLYRYSQTTPFEILIKDGKFIKNEYGSIYINKNARFPEGTTLIQEKVRYVCKKHGFEHTEVIQGFEKRIPNVLGFLIFEKDRERILQLYQERVEYLKEKKKASEQNELKSLWRKLFKGILIADSLQQRYAQAAD